MVKYASVQAIVDAFYPVRLAAYEARRTALLAALSLKLVRVSNKVAYIKAVLDGTVDLRGKKHGDITALLGKCGLVEVDGDYNYLTKMPMDSVSAENVEALTREMKVLKAREAELQGTPAATFWLRELEALSGALK